MAGAISHNNNPLWRLINIDWWVTQPYETKKRQLRRQIFGDPHEGRERTKRF